MSGEISQVHGGTAPLTALTTVFTPPCPTTWLLTSSKLASQYPPFPTDGPASCDPPGWDRNIADKAFQYYSPAICPSAFTVGCFVTEAKTAEGFPAVERTETAAFCVPSGFACTSDTTDFRGGIWGFVASPTGDGSTFTAGPALQIRWADSDLSLLETHPLTPGLLLAAATSLAESTKAPEPTSGGDLTPSSRTSTTTIPGFSRNPTTSQVLPTKTDPPATDPGDTVTSKTNLGLPSTSGSDQSSDATRSTSSSSPQGGVLTSNSGPTIAIVVLLSTLITIILAAIAFTLVRRRRRKGEPKAGRSWLSYLRPRNSPSDTRPPSYGAQDAELGGPTKAQELGAAYPRGTSQNPAELDGNATARPRPISEGWGIRLWKRLSFRSGRTGVTRSRPSTSHTHLSFASSEVSETSDWESISKPDGHLRVPPRAAVTRTSTTKTISSTARLSRDTIVPPKQNRAVRMSGETFGRNRFSGSLGVPSPRMPSPRTPSPRIPSPRLLPSDGGGGLDGVEHPASTPK